MRSVLAPEPDGPVETVGEAGGLSAAVALASFCEADVVPRSVACVRLERFVAHRPELVVAVTFEMSGALSGPLSVLFRHDVATQLAARHLHDVEQGTFPLSPLAEEVLVELGEITADAYVSGVTTTMDDSVTLSIPDLKIGAGQDVLPFALKGVHRGRVIVAPLVVDGCEIVVVHGI